MTENFSTEHAPAGGYDLVVFDWDGTILDTTAAISLSIQRAAEKMGLPVPSTQRANAVIGLGWREAIQIVAPTCPVEEYRTFSSFYAQSYLALEEEVHLFPGIEALIRALAGAGGRHREKPPRPCARAREDGACRVLLRDENGRRLRLKAQP